ncbi:MAG: hypothetical protein WA426_06040, partial [Silvibacterium sp.]
MKFAPVTSLIALLLLSQAPNLAPAQQSATQQTTPQTAPAQQSSQDQTAPPADGGPTGDNGAIAIPKKSEPESPAPPPPPAPPTP